MSELYDAIKGWKHVEQERTQTTLFAARRVGFCVLLSVGWKGREEEILHLKMDDEERDDLIKQFGYIKITKPDAE